MENNGFKISLKALRVNKTLTQEQAGKLIGVRKETISNWEKGKTFPDVEQIQKIEKVYGVKYDNINFSPKDNG